MPQLTSSGWSRARNAPSVTELKILSAVLQSPLVCEAVQRNLGHETRYPRDQTRGAARRQWSDHGSCLPRQVFIHRRNLSIQKVQFHTLHRRYIQKHEFWQPLEGDLSTGIAPETRNTIEEEDNKEDKQQTAVIAADGTQICTLCNEEFLSEDEFEKHLVSCWPKHQGSSLYDETEIAPEELSQWSPAEEKEKLEQVRRLEDELRKARHELQAISRKRKASQGVSSLLDIYKIGTENHGHLLSKEDYQHLVDLYFHSKQVDSAAAPDASPNPIFLEDQSLDNPFEPDTNDENKPGSLPLLADLEQKLRDDKLEEIATIESFVDLLLDDNSRYEAIFQTYQMFPSPGVNYLPPATIRTFLHRMGLPPAKTPTNMLRYLSIIDDMQAAKIPITLAEWNTALHLAGKSFHSIGEPEVRRSMTYWKKMEEQVGIKASNVTFNILFDTAVKAGQFMLAKSLFEEMTGRGLRLNRVGRISHIWYLGKLGQADEIRQAYHDFVGAGEIVDTLVLNTVMVALCNAGEGQGAEQVYERMKSMKTTGNVLSSRESRKIFTRYPPPGPQSYGSQKGASHLRRILTGAPRLRRHASDNWDMTAANASLMPDAFTFRTLIAYHIEKTGNLDRVAVLLEDMTNIAGLQISTLTFLLLFKGFAMNGTMQKSKWSAARLQMVWDMFSAAMKANTTARSVGLMLDSKRRRPKFPKPGLQQIFSSEDFFKQRGLFAVSAEGEKDSSPFEESGDHDVAPQTEEIDIERMRSQVFDESPWGRLLRDFAGTPEDKEEADLDKDPAGGDEPQAFPFQRTGVAKVNENDYYKIQPSKWLIVWVLRAFSTVTKNRRQVEEIYLELMDHWQNPTAGQKHTVEMVMLACLQDIEDGVFDRQWWRKRAQYKHKPRPTQ